MPKRERKPSFPKIRNFKKGDGSHDWKAFWLLVDDHLASKYAKDRVDPERLRPGRNVSNEVLRLDPKTCRSIPARW